MDVTPAATPNSLPAGLAPGARAPQSIAGDPHARPREHPQIRSDSAVDYPALFRANIVRTLQSVADALASQYAHSTTLPEDVRERALHLVSFALKLRDAWPQTRAVLLSLAPWMEIQGYWQSWGEVLQQGLKMAEALDDRQACARLNLQIGRTMLLSADHEAAHSHLTASQQIAEEIDDTTTLVEALDRLAVVAKQRADYVTARTLIEAAFARLDADAPQRMPGYMILGEIAVYHGEWEMAIAHTSRALELADKQGDPPFRARALHFLGIAYMASLHHDEALTTLDEALHLYSATGNSYAAAIINLNLAIVHWQRKDYSAALNRLDQCEPVLLKLGSRATIARVHNNRGLNYRELGRFEEAKGQFALALQCARLDDDKTELANILESLAGLHIQLGELDAAAAVLHQALDELASLPEQPRHVRGELLARLDEIAALQGAAGTAPSRETQPLPPS